MSYAKNLYFYGLEAFENFTKLHTVENPDKLDRYLDATSYQGKDRAAERAELVRVFKDTAEIVEVFTVHEYHRTSTTDNQIEGYFFESLTLALNIRGRYYRAYRPRYNKKMYALTDFECLYFSHVYGFEFKQEAPNLIGSATAKKVGAWVDYLTERRNAHEAYAREAYDANRGVAAIFKSKYPDNHTDKAQQKIDGYYARYDEAPDGWTYEFVIEKNGLRYEYSATNSPNAKNAFSRNVTVDYLSVPDLL
jgi:hypothetical protein